MNLTRFLTYKKINISVWILVACYLVSYSLFSKDTHVSALYYHVAHNWLNSQNLYSGGIWSFLYFPQSAILYIPYAILPFKVSEVAWRLTNVILLATCLWKIVNFTPISNRNKFCILLTLAGYTVAMGSLREGQMTITIAALLIYSITLLLNNKWWECSILLILAIAIKPISVIYVGTVFILYKPLRLKLIILFVLALILPFICQHPSYALQQYKNFYLVIHNAVIGTQGGSNWAQLFSLIYNIFHIKIPNIISYPVRVVAGALIVIALYAYKKTYNTKFFLLLLLTFTGAYLMLFNPRTESNDYIILFPATLWLCFYYFEKTHSKWLQYSTVFYIILITFNHGISAAIDITNTILRPLATLFFMIQLLYNIHFSKCFDAENK